LHKYIIMGPQGSGKGTQARLLCEGWSLVHISMGEIFRWHMASKTKLATRVTHHMTIGRLVPDETVEQVLKERLALQDWNHGFVLDGFPRTVHQARFFMENYDVDAVIVLTVSEELVLKRIFGRRVCDGCGRDFNIHFRPPAQEGTCDTCGGKLHARADDKPEAIAQRLSEYREKTEPVIELLGKKERVINVLAEGDASAVHSAISRELGLSK
jgi:adenylate kinase